LYSMDAVAPSEVLESLYAFVSQESRYILWNEAVSERKLLIWHYNCYSENMEKICKSPRVRGLSFRQHILKGEQLHGQT
jgi:hypothetical protein